MKPQCTFCGQIAGDPKRNDIAGLIRDRWAMRPVIAETGLAVVMPSIGALVPGHVLVSPASHLRSVFGAPHSVAEAVGQLVVAMREQLEAATGLPTHVFEHGSSSCGDRVACSIEHAHVHVLPAAVDLVPILADIAPWEIASHDQDRLSNLIGDAEYLFYEGPTGERMIATTSTGFPSQLMRQVFARELGLVDWNWRTNPALDRIRATVDLLRCPALV